MVRNKSACVVLLFSLFLSFGLLCSAKDFPGRRGDDDPSKRYEDCRRRCEWDTRGQKEQQQCEESCKSQYGEKGQQQRHRPEDPQRRYEECQQECRQQEERQQPQCQQRCLKRFEQEQQQSQRQFQECQQHCHQQEQRPEKKQQCVRECREKYQENPWRGEREEEAEEEETEEGEQEQSHNPFHFHRRSFQSRFREEHGNFRVLQRFASRHPILRGINEFRLSILEANPNTFVLPHHCDAEKIYLVTNGRGTLTFLTHENKESYNIVPGVVVKVPAGSTVYLANQDNKEKLIIAVLHRPVNNPGQFEEFFPAGSQRPQSYLRAFSREILEPAFNTRSEQLDELFGGRQSRRRQQGQGMFRKASQEQIRALSQEATSPREKSGERFAFNLLSQTPRYSNQNGRFFEACPREFRQLRDINVTVSALQLNQGSIFVPHYNSKATFVILVTEGNGYAEMVSPHLPRQSSYEEEEEEEEEEEQEQEQEQEEERRSGQYRKIRSRLSRGDIFVVPANFPVTFVASQNQNLRMTGFGLYNQNINPDHNQRIFVAGKINHVRQWDSQAKELAFGVSSRLVDEIFNSNPQESYFVSRQRQRASE